MVAASSVSTVNTRDRLAKLPKNRTASGLAAWMGGPGWYIVDPSGQGVDQDLEGVGGVAVGADLVVDGVEAHQSGSPVSSVSV